MIQSHISLLSGTQTKLRPPFAGTDFRKNLAALHVNAHHACDRYIQVLFSLFLAAAYCEHFCAAVAIVLNPSLPMKRSELKVQTFVPNAAQMFNSFLLQRSPLPSSYHEFRNVYLFQKDKRACRWTRWNYDMQFSFNTTHFFSFSLLLPVLRLEYLARVT